MTDEINLNNQENLNPIIPKYKPLPTTNDLFKDKKEEEIKKWNEKKEVKEKNIEAIDKDKFDKIKKNKLTLLNVLAIVGIISLICLIGISILYGYTLYKDKTMISPTNLFCSNVSLKCETQNCVNTCNKECPACIVSLNSTCNFPDRISIKYENKTN